MPFAELSAGRIEYADSGGSGPVLVLLHGVLMDGRQWREVVPRLEDFRCVVPNLPLGAHRTPMNEGADLSLRGQARIVAEFLDVLGLDDVTLAFNDWACPQILVADGLTERIGRLVLVACETAGNYPPGWPGRTLALLGAVPGGIRVGLAALRLRPLRHTPLTFGWLSKRGLPDDLLSSWLAPARADPRIRRDLAAYVSRTPQGKRDLVAASARLAQFDRPVLVVWAESDRIMPMTEGRALAAAFPQARFETVGDSYTLVPLDQPGPLADLIREFVAPGRSVRDRNASSS